MSSDAATKPGARSPWLVVAVLTLVYVFSFLDRSILALLVEPIKRDLAISDTEMSYLLGFSFALFYAVFGLPLGRLADSANRVRLIAAGLFVWNLATAGCAFAQRYWHLLLLRMGVGVGEATLGPSAYSIISDSFPRDRLAGALSVYSTGIYIGAGLSTMLGGAVATFAQSRGEIALPVLGAFSPWQTVFLVIGALGLLPLLLLLSLREPERKTLVSRPYPIREVLGYLWRNRRAVAGHHLGFAVLAFSSYGAGAWIPAYLVRRHGWSIGQVGLWLGLVSAVMGTLGLLSGGFIADRLNRRGVRDGKLRVGLVAAVAWFPAGIAYPLAPNGTLAMLFLVVAVYFSSFGAGAAAAAIQELVPPRMRGQASAVYLFAANLIGLGLGPTAIALCTDYLFRSEDFVHYSLVTVGVAAHLVAAAVFWRTLPHYRETLDRLDAEGA